MASAATATPAAAATDVLGEVIAIHSLEAWTIQIEEANAAKRLVRISRFLSPSTPPFSSSAKRRAGFFCTA
jgi:thioredoxin 1